MNANPRILPAPPPAGVDRDRLGRRAVEVLSMVIIKHLDVLVEQGGTDPAIARGEIEAIMAVCLRYATCLNDD